MIERFHLLLSVAINSSDAAQPLFGSTLLGSAQSGCGNIFFQVVPPLRPGIGTMSSP